MPFRYFLFFFVPKKFVIFTSCIIQIACFYLAWILQPLQFRLLPMICWFWEFSVSLLFIPLSPNNSRLSLVEIMLLYLIISQALLMFALSSEFRKAANLFQFSAWYCSLTSAPFNSLKLKITKSNFSCSFACRQSLPSCGDRQIAVSQLAPLKVGTYVCLNAAFCPSWEDQSDSVLSHQGKSKYIYECWYMGTLYSW
jgi:hypothetical protein